MILIDANLLLYAHNTDAPQHLPARRWLESVLSGQEPVGLPWVAILAFLRLSTDVRAFPRPWSMNEASAFVAAWLARPNVDPVHPTERHWQILERLLAAGQVRGPLVTDTHFAALAIEHGATLCTTDRDFARFPGLKWINPLE